MSQTNIHPSAVIGENTELAEGVIVGPNAVIGDNCKIGKETQILSGAILGDDVVMGERNRVFPGAVIGYQPQLLIMPEGQKLGGLVIGDGNTIREFVTIHPAMHAGANTSIGNSNLIMVGVHVGHDCTVANNIVISNNSQLSGHCHVKDGAWLSGMVAVHQFVTISEWCYCAGMSGINHDVPPFMIIQGHYPPRVRGVNKRGVVRGGYGEDQVTPIMRTYKALYKSGKPLLESAKELASNEELDKCSKMVVDTILKSSEHRFGRYLEQFRH